MSHDGNVATSIPHHAMSANVMIIGLCSANMNISKEFETRVVEEWRPLRLLKLPKKSILINSSLGKVYVCVCVCVCVRVCVYIYIIPPEVGLKGRP